MNFWNSLAIGLREILAHKFRSFLTMAGVILGVASLLTTFALIEGLAKSNREMLNSMGGVERVNVINQEVPARQIHLADTSPGRTVMDAEVIREQCNLVSAVAPIYEVGAMLRRDGNDFRNSVRGVWPDHVAVNNHNVVFGRNLCQLDLDEARHVCVIGRKVIQELWPEQPESNPLGQTILVNDRPFRVVGILEYYESDDTKRARAEGRPAPKSKFGGRWSPYDRKNMTFLVPFTTMFYDFKSAGGSPSGGSTTGSANVANTNLADDPGPNYKIDELAFQVSDPNDMQPALDQVRLALLHSHRGVEDFTFDTRQEWSDSINESTKQIRLVGGLISSIALIVGGIGITNIMLASITERIREIGVRRAVGAKSRHIFTQIVVESTVVAILGGLLGTVAAMGLMKVVESFSDSKPILNVTAALLSFASATAIGIVSGLYPAWRASRIEPIEALRYG
jgi:putative ABC transport system permease protein